MKIAILGMGRVGSTLGRRWIEAGHQIVFGVRDPDKKRTEAEELQADVLPIPDAAASADTVLLAVPMAAVPEVLKTAGDLSGKVLLDCTNPVTPQLTHLTLGFTTSAGEEVAKRAPGAKVVKIFNTNGVGNMADPDYGNMKVTMLYAGNDDAANKRAAELAREIGMEPVWLGSLKEARLLEPLAMTWILLARRGLGREFALNIVRRPKR